MDSPLTTSIHFDPNPTLGALQVGVLVSSLLFGLSMMQTYLYFTRFPGDDRKLKALVIFVWYNNPHVASFSTGLKDSSGRARLRWLCAALYRYTIIDYGHPERLLQPTPKSLQVAVFFCGIIAACVQSFFSHHIYSLSNTLYIPLFTWALSFVRLLATTAACATGLRMVNIESYEAQWGWLGLTLWSVSTANDFIIAATLVFLLIRQRRNAQKNTAALVDKVIAWTIETGTATSAFGIATLTCYLTMPNNFIWIAIFIVGARLFSNSLLASLKSRITLRALKDASVPFSTPVIHLSTTRPSSMRFTNAAQAAASQLSRGTQSKGYPPENAETPARHSCSRRAFAATLPNCSCAGVLKLVPFRLDGAWGRSSISRPGWWMGILPY
ncbi:hypothetical protein C8R46DRAFT_1341519 [Mycena filopes]|nr:hypothetical protein C8R46DRAFT_1341519 [Mycena filopes]